MVQQRTRRQRTQQGWRTSISYASSFSSELVLETNRDFVVLLVVIAGFPFELSVKTHAFIELPVAAEPIVESGLPGHLAVKAVASEPDGAVAEEVVLDARLQIKLRIAAVDFRFFGN